VQEETPAPVDPEMEEAERKRLIEEKRREKLQYKVKLRLAAAFEKKAIPWSSVFVVAMGLLALYSHAYFNHLIRVRLPTSTAPCCQLPHAGCPTGHHGTEERRAQLWVTCITSTRRVPEFSPTVINLPMPIYTPFVSSSARNHVQQPQCSW
jgi:hypothetical protein